MVLVDSVPLPASAYENHYKNGSEIAKFLPSNFNAVFLPACTHYCNEEWERSLILNWSAIELAISKLWEQSILAGCDVAGIPLKRRKNFLSDSRTWTSSTRIEMLWQNGIIDDKTYSLLDRSRLCRNSFVHSAKKCSPEDARTTLSAVLALIAILSKDSSVTFSPETLINQFDESTTVFCRPTVDASGRLLVEPKYWRYPDPAPGFKDWGDREFEKIPEIMIRPLG